MARQRSQSRQRSKIGPKRRPPSPRAPRPRRRGRKLLPWLVLGGVGLVAALWRRGEPGGPVARPADRPADPSPEPLSFEPPADAQESWITGPGGALRVVEVHPEAPLTLVFIHGLGGRLEHWMPQLSAAGPGIRAIALDLPGHGGSDIPVDAPMSVADLAAAIAATLDVSGLRRAVLVGHSLGAAAAIEYAASHPERVQGLILVDPNGDQTQLPDDQRKSLLAAVERDPRSELGWQYRQILLTARTEVADRVLADLEATDETVLVTALAASLDHSPLPALERYSGPVHTVISDLNDLPNSLHRLRPDLPVRYITDTSHWLMLDRPEDFWEVLLDTLDALREEGAV